jgi:hypothetical protein
MLKNMGLPIPPDAPGRDQSKYRIGDVIGVTGNTVQFVATGPLKGGDVVWLMKPGWDFHYENQSAVPAARAVVVSQSGKTHSAEFRLLPSARSSDVTKGMPVHNPPKPADEKASIRLEPGTPARISGAQPLKRLTRLLARGSVWNKEGTGLVLDNIGYVVVTDPAVPTGYMAIVRSKYSYVPLNSGAGLSRVTDPNETRWLGTIISIGRGGQTIEVATNRDRERLAADLASGKRFDVLLPPWNAGDKYSDRLVGKAALKSLDKKIVLQMLEYAPGWDIRGFANGLDVYEHKPEEKK